MAWLGALLCALGARFPDPSLELRYRQFRITQYFMKEDGFQATLRLCVIGTFALRGLFLNGPVPSTAGAFALLLAPLAQLAMRATAGARGCTPPALAAYLRHRTALVVTLRILILPSVAGLWFWDFFQPPGESKGLLQMASYLSFGSGAQILLLPTVANPVLLETHLAIQPIATLMMVTWRQASFCREALESPGGPRHVLAAWRALDGASLNLLRAMYGQDMPQSIEPEPSLACRHVVLGMYCALCLAVTTYVHWVLEHRSRVQFLETTGRRGAGAGWQPLGWVDVVLHAFLAAALFAVGWQALGRAVLERPVEWWSAEGGACAAEARAS